MLLPSCSFSALSAFRMLHKGVLQFSFPVEASGNGMRKVWAPRVGIMCMADSALALQRAQCPHENILEGKSLDGQEDFLESDAGNPCLGWPETVHPSERFSEL